MGAGGPFRQHVPRPLGGRPGLPPPWQGAFAGRPSVPLDLVRAALAQRVAPAPAPGRPARQAEAAVLVALFGEAAGAGEATLVLIRRSAHLDRDPGHVALPGGLIEAGEDPLAAALREAEEEVGLPPAAVEVVGSLATVVRPASRGSVLPFVGLLAERPVLSPSPAEVEAILEVPLAGLLAEGVAWEERWPVPTGDGATLTRRVCFFASEALGTDLVWGVTARIVWDLLERVTDALPRSDEGGIAPEADLLG